MSLPSSQELRSLWNKFADAVSDFAQNSRNDREKLQEKISGINEGRLGCRSDIETMEVELEKFIEKENEARTTIEQVRSKHGGSDINTMKGKLKELQEELNHSRKVIDGARKKRGRLDDCVDATIRSELENEQQKLDCFRQVTASDEALRRKASNLSQKLDTFSQTYLKHD